MYLPEPIFDIFRGGPSDKDAVWIESVEGLSSARERMQQIAVVTPGQYFVFSRSSHYILARIDTRRKSRRLSPFVPIAKSA
jgi:hypothetical protein